MISICHFCFQTLSTPIGRLQTGKQWQDVRYRYRSPCGTEKFNWVTFSEQAYALVISKMYVRAKLISNLLLSVAEKAQSLHICH